MTPGFGNPNFSDSGSPQLADGNIYELYTAADENIARQIARARDADQREQYNSGEALMLHPLMRGIGDARIKRSKESEDLLAGAGQHRLAQAMEMLKARENAAAKKTHDWTKLEMDLANDYLGNQDTKAMQNMVGAYSQVRSAPLDGTADATLIYGMAKILDPGGRVTDGDVDMQGRRGELEPWLQSAWNKVTSGGSLGDGVRQKMIAEAGRIMREKAGVHELLRKSFKTRAAAYGVDPDRVVPELFDVPRPQGSRQTKATPDMPQAFQDKDGTWELQPNGKYKLKEE